MKKTTLILSFILLVALSVTAQQTKWAIDKTHSKIRFEVAHMVISEVSGQFHSYDGSVLADEADFSDAKIDFSLALKSIDTDDDKRDEQLRSPDFFDVAKFPQLTFKSTSMQKTDKNNFKLRGVLSLHGVSKEIVLDVRYGGTVTDPYGNIKAGFKVSGMINRNDFGVKYNSIMDSGGLMIGEEVNISCSLELIQLK